MPDNSAEIVSGGSVALWDTSNLDLSDPDPAKPFHVIVGLLILKRQPDGKMRIFNSDLAEYPNLNEENMRLVEMTVIGSLTALGEPDEKAKRKK